MYPLFEDFWGFFFSNLKRQSVKQKFTLSCLGGSKFGCTMYRSQLLKEREGEGLVLVQQPGPGSAPIMMLKASKGGETDRWVGLLHHQSEADESAVTDSQGPAKVSLPDSDCHIQQAPLLRWRMASPSQEV